MIVESAIKMNNTMYIGFDQTHFIYGHMYKVEISDEINYIILECNGVQYRYESKDSMLRDWKFF